MAIKSNAILLLALKGLNLQDTLLSETSQTPITNTAACQLHANSRRGVLTEVEYSAGCRA